MWVEDKLQETKNRGACKITSIKLLTYVKNKVQSEVFEVKTVLSRISATFELTSVSKSDEESADEVGEPVSILVLKDIDPK